MTGTATGALLVGLALAPGAPSSAGPLVQVDVAPCLAADAASIRSVVALELRATLAQAEEQGTTSVALSCAGPAVEIRVSDPLTGKTTIRRIDAQATPRRSRARVLALAAAELATASWAELATNPAPIASPEGPAAPASAVAAARAVVEARGPRADRLRLFAVLEGRSFAGAAARAVGGGLRIERTRAWGAAGWAADLVASSGQAPVSGGRATIEAATAGIALTVTGAGALALVGAVGARGGVVRLRGRPEAPARAEARTVVGPWASPFVAAGGRGRLPGGLLASLTLELGYAPVHTTGTTLAGPKLALRGPWAGLQLALGGPG